MARGVGNISCVVDETSAQTFWIVDGTRVIVVNLDTTRGPLRGRYTPAELYTPAERTQLLALINKAVDRVLTDNGIPTA